MSCESNNSENAVSPIICPNEGGRIREGGDNRGTNSDSDSRPKGSGSSNNNKSKHAVSPIICPNEGGRIRERGESRGIDSDSDLILPVSNLNPN